MISRLVLLTFCSLSVLAADENTTTTTTTVTQVIAKICPDNNEYCLECVDKTCKRCGASYYDPNKQICVPPKAKISNCKSFL